MLQQQTCARNFAFKQFESGASDRTAFFGLGHFTVTLKKTICEAVLVFQSFLFYSLLVSLSLVTTYVSLKFSLAGLQGEDISSHSNRRLRQNPGLLVSRAAFSESCIQVDDSCCTL